MEPAAKEAAGDQPDAVQEVVTRLRSTLDRVDRIAAVDNQSGNQNVTNLRLETGAHTTIILLAAFSAVLMAAFALWFAKDARDEMRAQNISRERDIGELRQTDNAIRAYINTGVLKPKGK